MCQLQVKLLTPPADTHRQVALRSGGWRGSPSLSSGPASSGRQALPQPTGSLWGLALFPDNACSRECTTGLRPPCSQAWGETSPPQAREACPA